MENKLILVDTSVLIDFFRKTDKNNSVWIKLFDKGYNFSISSITYYEIYSGATIQQIPFWQSVLNRTQILDFNKATAQVAVTINNELKRKSQQIDIADLFIAATALANNLPLATLNHKHFERIGKLSIVG
jgi:predicted nucleic acid-binding protein